MVWDPSHDFHKIIKKSWFRAFPPISWAIAHNFGVRGDFRRDPVTRVSRNRKKSRDFGHFWPFSYAIVHGFGIPCGFIWFGTPSHNLHEIIENLWFQEFLTVFVGYSTRFCGPTWIYMVQAPSDDSQEIIKKLVISGISNRFHGL